MALVYSYLIAWIAGGVGLITMLLLGTQRVLIAASFALIGFGGCGFFALCSGVAGAQWPAATAGILLGSVGYLLHPRSQPFR